MISSTAEDRQSKAPRPVLLFFATIAVTLALWAVLPDRAFPVDSSDYKYFYAPVATAILQGRGPTLDGAPAIGHPPGYPLLLAVARSIARPLGLSEADATLALSLVSIAASSILLYKIAALLLLPLPSGTAYAMWVTYPFLLAISKAGLTEAPFCALLYAALLLVFRFVWRGKLSRCQAVGSGALLGCAMLVRPIAIGIPALLALVLALAKRSGDFRSRVRFTCGMVAGCLFLVIPWETWVFVRTGQWIPLSTNGVPSMRDGLTFAVNPAKTYRVQIPVSPDVKKVQLDVLRNCAGLRSAGNVMALLREEWRGDPWAVTKLVLTKAARSWYGTDSGRLDRYVFLIQAVYLSAGIAGGLLAAFDRKMLFSLAPIAALIAYFWVMTTVFLSILRYMLPAMGLIFILTAAGVESVLRAQIRNRREGSAVALTESG